MKVLQLIDSLQAGGAERVAVNLANALSEHLEQSFLCATREEGILKNSLDTKVGYLFLRKRKTIDVAAIKRLNGFVKTNQIDIIHAHSSSFFLAAIIRLLNKNIKLVWHDHYGQSEFLEDRPHKVLRYCSGIFDQVFSVNRQLEVWAKSHLKTKRIDYLPNFVVKNNMNQVTELHGKDGKRVVCLANLRPQKDHITLIDAFAEVVKTHPDWTLHCVGKDFNDDYSIQVKKKIKDLNLDKHVYLYGSRPDVGAILKQCTIGVLSSKSEGLPLALLEYGLSRLAVVATKVGECGQVLEDGKEGVLVEKENKKELIGALEGLIITDNQRVKFSSAFYEKVKSNYSKASILKKIVETYKTI